MICPLAELISLPTAQVGTYYYQIQMIVQGGPSSMYYAPLHHRHTLNSCTLCHNLKLRSGLNFLQTGHFPVICFRLFASQIYNRFLILLVLQHTTFCLFLPQSVLRCWQKNWWMVVQLLAFQFLHALFSCSDDDSHQDNLEMHQIRGLGEQPTTHTST